MHDLMFGCLKWSTFRDPPGPCGKFRKCPDDRSLGCNVDSHCGIAVETLGTPGMYGDGKEVYKDSDLTVLVGH